MAANEKRLFHSYLFEQKNKAEAKKTLGTVRGKVSGTTVYSVQRVLNQISKIIHSYIIALYSFVVVTIRIRTFKIL